MNDRVKAMTTEEKLTVALDALKQIRQLKEETFGDHWSFSLALRTDDVHDIVDQALCFCLPIEEVSQELIEQGIYTDGLKDWASERLREIKERNPIATIIFCEECGKGGDNHPIECSKHWYNASASDGEKLSEELKS